MKTIIIILLLVISTLTFGQDYSFKPNWNKGESKIITITQAQKEYENENLISDTTRHNKVSIKVLKVNKEDYTLEIHFENQALLAAIKFYNKLGEELEDYNDLKLIYSVNKETSESELLNWKESQKFMNKSFEQITKILEEKAPEMAPYTGMLFMPLKEIFKSKENTEAYMESTIGYLLIPFKQDFVIGKPIRNTESQENPFNPTQEISSTTISTLESVNEPEKTCIIKQEVKLDLSEFIEMMKNMMQQMSKSFGANDSITAIKSEEMDSFEMDMKNLQVITFDYESTWVTKVVSSEIITATDPKKGVTKKTEVVTTTIIK
jgi:hypothetical protein